MKTTLIKAAVLVSAAAVGCLGTWVLINWLPTLVILAGGGVFVYVTFKNIDNLPKI